MNFKQAERRFKQLEEQLATEKLSEEDFKAQLEELMVQDDQGNWWVIGYETKQWYCYDGKEWVQTKPPRKWSALATTASLAAVISIIISLSTWWIITSLQPPSNTGEPGPAGPQGDPGIQGEQGPQGEPGTAASIDDFTCSECHNNLGEISAMAAAWSASLHGTGITFDYGGSRASCAGCHSGRSFQALAALGITPDQVESGDPNPTRQNCYTCHQIHTTYTAADWTLTTMDTVTIYAFEDMNYEGGEGNLCANCHQPRRQIADADNGIIEVTSTAWGPHHGPNSTLLLGIGGAGDVLGRPSAHYTMVEDTCVACHLGENNDHSLEPSVTSCQPCHGNADNFDINGSQTEVDAKLDELLEWLIAMGMWDETDSEPVLGQYPADQAAALWNYIFIAVEDSSLGIHNPSYTKALLDWSIEALQN